MSDDPFGLTGQVIDAQLRVDRAVGEGGFSVVYKGHHLGLDEPVAIKCLKLSTALDDELVDSFIRRFRDESRICYRLSRGNLDIVRSITSGTTTTPAGTLVPYMALEWLDGQSLADELKERRGRKMQGRPLEEVVALFDPAANAIAYAHEQGVVHRDIKPGNLFLCASKEGPRMKVLDFGLAKILHDELLGISPHQTGGGVFLFSPSYGAPEQFDPKLGKIGPWTDVYALAIVMLEALRDRKLRSNDSVANSVIHALDPTNRPTPRRYGVPVGDAVEAVLARAVALRPDKRQKDAGELWKQLHDAMHRDGAVALTKTAENEAMTIVEGRPKKSRPPRELALTVREGKAAIASAPPMTTTLRMAEPILPPSALAASVVAPMPTVPPSSGEETGGTGTLVMDRPEIPRRPSSQAPPLITPFPAPPLPQPPRPSDRPSARPRSEKLSRPVGPWLDRAPRVAASAAPKPSSRRRTAVLLLLLFAVLLALGALALHRAGLLRRLADKWRWGVFSTSNASQTALPDDCRGDSWGRDQVRLNSRERWWTSPPRGKAWPHQEKTAA
jgi:serine/threonine protein kinase